MQYLVPMGEIILLAALQLAIFLNTSRNPLSIFYLCFFTFMGVSFLLGFPKSAFHLLLVVNALYFALCKSWGGQSTKIIQSGLVIGLVFLIIPEMVALFSGSGFANKLNAPALFPLWILMIVVPAFRKFKTVIVAIIIATIIIAVLASARGILLASVPALLYYIYQRKLPAMVYFVPFLAAFLIYSFATPLMDAVGYNSYLNSSASNWQRAMMNDSALKDTISTLFTMNESRIFDSAIDFRYSYDMENLSVHNIFLAFGLFNGLIPALILLFSCLSMVTRHRNSPLACVMMFLFIYMLLGPDTSVTRFSLMTIFACSALSVFATGKNRRPKKRARRNPAQALA